MVSRARGFTTQAMLTTSQEQYSEWFFVNIHTKKSQWDKPTSPAYPAGEAPDAPPPSYAPPADGQRLSSEKSRLGTNNPYAGTGGTSSQNLSEDEKLARQLQEEEEARARGDNRGAADSFYSQGAGGSQAGQYGYGQQGQQGPYASQGQGYGGSSADTQDKGKSKDGGDFGGDGGGDFGGGDF
ncbi:hypothetical protein K491DRAFT_94122 [Lophiostoma macrostomum CBS 122681]|uniref:WW domain-containing protein n=1 Tax=Lophiostoma macrostomum CBS 122681 TaxID=1314788 RepID=A0A6A6TLU7_9PLEO|nr:hypothetical protein K491DRAFT_94122 [Lophiostoma macrostomum CBS 122681]